jgi:hypothetical protein
MPLIENGTLNLNNVKETIDLLDAEQTGAPAPARRKTCLFCFVKYLGDNDHVSKELAKTYKDMQQAKASEQRLVQRSTPLTIPLTLVELREKAASLVHEQPQLARAYCLLAFTILPIRYSWGLMLLHEPEDKENCEDPWIDTVNKQVHFPERSLKVPTLGAVHFDLNTEHGKILVEWVERMRHQFPDNTYLFTEAESRQDRRRTFGRSCKTAYMDITGQKIEGNFQKTVRSMYSHYIHHSNMSTQEKIAASHLINHELPTGNEHYFPLGGITERDGEGSTTSTPDAVSSDEVDIDDHPIRVPLVRRQAYLPNIRLTRGFIESGAMLGKRLVFDSNDGGIDFFIEDCNEQRRTVPTRRRTR